MKIHKLKHHPDGSWTFRTEYNKGCWYTDCNGEGLFFQDDRTGEIKQVTGTCQFSACKTESGTRRKLAIIMEDHHDPMF